jgi:two-component system, LuxR family, response regulator FixJ
MLLEILRGRGSTIPTIVVTGFVDVSAAVKTMKLGVADFLSKPVDPAMLVCRIK